LGAREKGSGGAGGDPLDRLRREWDEHSKVYDLVYGATEERRLAEEWGFLSFAFERLARRPVSEVLDLTAGTGLQAVGLARRGFEVTAADISPGMLERCEERAARAGVSLAGLVCRPASDTAEVERFDAAISCFFGLCHVLREEELEDVFGAVHRALRPGGLFVFDTINLLEDALSGAPLAERSGIRGGERFRSSMESRYDTWRSLLHFGEETEVVSKRRKTRVRADFTYRGWARSEVVAALSPFGWSEVRAFRGWEDRGKSEEERVFAAVFACRK